MRKLTTALATIGIGAVVSAGLISPAQAADDAALSIRVTDAKGQAIRGITIALDSEDTGLLFLGSTGADGRLSTDQDEDGAPLTTGAWDLYVSDDDDGRRDAGSSYGSLTTPITLESGSNDLGTRVLQRTSRVTGFLTAPSKRPIRNITVQMDRVRTSEDDGYDYEFSDTDAKGAYRFGNLAPGSWNLVRSKSPSDEYPTVQVRRFTVGIDQDLKQNISNVLVPCNEKGFKASSTGPGKVKLSVRASASKVGLTNPKGRIVVKRGSTTVKTITVRSGSTVSTTITKQPKGKKVTYTASYGKGDCSTWSKKASVKIKK